MNDPLSAKDIQHIASLANLLIDARRYKLYASQLSTILAFVSKLQKIPTNNLEPTAQVTELTNVYREDVVDESRMLTQKEALRNARKTHKGYFVVPALFEQ